MSLQKKTVDNCILFYYTFTINIDFDFDKALKEQTNE